MLRSDPFEMSMFERRLSVNLLGEPAWIATAEDVILHKLYWDSLTPSERQISDAAGVVAVQSDSLDRAYLQQWADEVGVSEKLNRLLAGEIKPKKHVARAHICRCKKMAHLNLKPKTGVPPVRADMPLSCQMKRQARSPSAMTAGTAVFRCSRDFLDTLLDCPAKPAAQLRCGI